MLEILGIAAGVLLGFVVLTGLRRGDLVENLFLAPSIGLGLIAWFMYLSDGVLGVGFSSYSLGALALVVTVASILLIFVQRRYLGWRPAVSRPLKLTDVIAFVLVAAPIATMMFFIAYFNLSPIVIFYDNVAYVAKLIFFTGHLPGHVALTSLQYANAFPPLLSLQGVFLYFLAGRFDDLFLRIYPTLYFATFIGLVAFYGKRLRLGLALTMLVAVFVFSNQQTVFLSESVNPNAPLAVYAAISMLFVLLYAESAQRRYLLGSGISAGLAAFSAYNGIPLALSVFIGLLICARENRKFRDLSIYALSTLAIALPLYVRNWYLFGNPVYPYLGSVFSGKGYLFLPSLWANLVSLDSTVVVWWSLPPLILFGVALLYISRERTSLKAICAACVAYSLAILLTSSSADWPDFTPVILPMSLLAAVALEHLKPSKWLLLLGGGAIGMSAFGQYVTNPVGTAGFFSLTSIVAYGVAIVALAYLALRARSMVAAWTRVGAILVLLLLLVVPTYAAANLDYVTVSVNGSPYPPSLQLYVNFTTPSPRAVVLYGFGSQGGMRAVELWVDANVPGHTPFLTNASNIYYLDRLGIPVNGTLGEKLSQMPVCDAITYLQSRNITTILLQKGGPPSSGSGLIGSLIPYTTLLYAYEQGQVLAISRTCSTS